MENRRRFLDDHHLVFPGRVHNVYEPSKAIRASLLARDMPRDMHEELHKHTAPVPLMGYYALMRVASNMDGEYNNIVRGVDDFSFGVEKANAHPRALPDEIAVNELALKVVRGQLDFLRDSGYFKIRSVE